MITEQEYIENGGNNCPYCNSDDIESQTPELENGFVFVEVCCNSCEKYWIEEFTMTGVKFER